MLEVGPGWLEPTKFDLTYTNVKTQKCVINNTEVGLILPHKCSLNGVVFFMIGVQNCSRKCLLHRILRTRDES